MRHVLVIVILVQAALLLGGCESLLVRLRGGSNSGVDWSVGVEF